MFPIFCQTHQASVQDDWAVPMDAFTHGQLTARNRLEHRPGASNLRHHQPRQSRRALLTPSSQSALTATGSGILLYHPTGYSIDGADLTQFFMEAHSNTNVTGETLPFARSYYAVIRLEH